ncbi:MAG: aspartate aminotransferase family protein [Rickettsiales bacterium]
MNAASPLLNVYRRTNIVMDRGEGVYLYDTHGKRYLDCAAGIAVNVLGHTHPAVVDALKKQLDKLWHCSNYFHTQPLDRFAAALTQASGMDQVFFGSSGTEAVEAAIKMIRRYSIANGKPERTDILVAESAFHGRTLGALSACGHEKSREGFGKLLDGFATVPFNNLDVLEYAINENTAGILLETIQGEGGIRPHTSAYLKKIRELANEYDLILALDEVQCGYGRTGSLFAYQEAGIEPDIVIAAKGIGGGFPLSAALVKAKVGKVMTPGSHGSTYGSNPLACAVGQAVLTEILKPGFLEHVSSIGKYFTQQLQDLCKDFPLLFSTVRGRGLMLGVAFSPTDNKYLFANQLLEAGLIVAPAVTDVLRILPPLTITKEHVDEAIRIFRQVAENHRG